MNDTTQMDGPVLISTSSTLHDEISRRLKADGKVVVNLAMGQTSRDFHVLETLPKNWIIGLRGGYGQRRWINLDNVTYAYFPADEQVEKPEKGMSTQITPAMDLDGSDDEDDDA